MSPRALETQVQSKPIEMMTMADAIRADLAAGDAGYRAAGTKFLAQKKALPHGEWLPWLKAEGFSQQTANRYMRFANSSVVSSFAEWLDQQEPSRQQPSPPRPTVPTPKASKAATTELSPTPPDLHVPDDEDEVLSETVNKKGMKTPANPAPAPKLKPGSPGWVAGQVDTLCKAAHNLQSTYPKLTGGQQRQIRKAQRALEHLMLQSEIEREWAPAAP